MASVIRSAPRMDRRRTEGDQHYQVHVQDLSRRTSKTKGKLRPMPPLVQLHDFQSKLQPPSPSHAFQPLAVHPSSPQSKDTELRKWPLGRRSTLPALLDVSTEALMLSRQLHLDFHEVKFVVQELRREGRRLKNGGMDVVSFRQILLRVLGSKTINDYVVQDAYAECRAAEGPLDSRKFLSWYRDHIFELEGQKEQVEDLTLELAKKHQCSCLDLDKVKMKFDHFDVDKSGVIDYQEFESMMYQLLHCSSKSDLPPNRLQRFWNEADQDRNGTIDFQEFTEWYMKYFSESATSDPVEAFYQSFMPNVQRGHTLDSLIHPQVESKWDEEALTPYLKCFQNVSIDLK